MALPAPKPNDYPPDVVARASAAATLETLDRPALEELYAFLETARVGALEHPDGFRLSTAGAYDRRALERGIEAALRTVYRAGLRPAVHLVDVIRDRCESPVCPRDHDVHGRHRTAVRR